MDRKEEYHDPDYPEAPVLVKEDTPSVSEEDKIVRIKSIINREFTNELEIRENEVMLIDQKMSTARRLLHRLRYALVNSYYRDQKLQLTSGQIQDEVEAQTEPRARTEVATLLRDAQKRIHPSVRKLLGKHTVDLDEIFRTRGPRKRSRKDYSAMVQCRNYTIAADSTKSLRPELKSEPDALQEEPSTSRPKKIPRHKDPRVESNLTLDEITRNKMKQRYRIIIGNTSKYAPPASRADRSTHKWLLYVRGPGDSRVDVSRVLRAVTVRLHHSYAPHHTVHVTKPPFHVSRRGWGEFPAKIELHFALPERNRPATVEHTIKLDRNYTGLQTLGAETVVDVWLYSTPDMLEFEYKDEHTEIQTDIQTETQTDIQTEIQPKDEPMDPEPEPSIDNTIDEYDKNMDSWLDFFKTEVTELDVDEMIIKPVKKERVDEEKNDIENLIESNVISKEPKNDINEVTLDTINNSNIDANLNKSNNANSPSSKTIKTEQNDWGVNYDYDSIDNPENLPNEILNQPTTPKKRIMKYMDPTTGKIYYLEMDRDLDLSKVQEIVINSKGNIKTAKISPIKPNGLKHVKKNIKKGVSLLKPEVKSLLKNDFSNNKNEKSKPTKYTNHYSHIENDHCYLGSSWSSNICLPPNSRKESILPEFLAIDNNIDIVKKEKSLYDCLCSTVTRFNCVRVAVNFLLKKIPLISEEARDPDFLKYFPFVVENDEKYWKMDFAKRRNIEWSRAKLINKIVTEYLKGTKDMWRTKQILIFSRLHGYYPIRQEIQKLTETNTNEWSSWNDLENSRLESNIKELYPTGSDINTLSLFERDKFLVNESLSESVNLTDSDEEIDIVRCDFPVRVKKEVLTDTSGSLPVLPVENEESRLRYMFIERKCSDIGIELRNEDIGHGYSYSAVHAVLLSAMKSFAEELVRGALAAQLATARTDGAPASVWTGSSSRRQHVSLEHVYAAISSEPRLHALSAAGLATEHKDVHAL